MKKLKVSVLSALALAGLALSVCASANAQSATAKTDYECLIQPRAIVKIASPVSGIVSKVFVEEGARVSAGDILATLNSDVEAANLKLSRVRAAYDGAIKLSTERAELARKKAERAQQLKEKNVISVSSLDEVETEARIAELSIEQARHEKVLAELEVVRFEAALEQKTIRSPVDGMVVKRLLWPGESTNEEAQMMTIAELDPLEVRMFAPTSLYGSVEIGSVAEIRPNPPLEGVYEARVSVIDKVFDAASDTFRILLQLPNADSALPAGVPCRLTFIDAND